MLACLTSQQHARGGGDREEDKEEREGREEGDSVKKKPTMKKVRREFKINLKRERRKKTSNEKVRKCLTERETERGRDRERGGGEEKEEEEEKKKKKKRRRRSDNKHNGITNNQTFTD